MVPTEDYSFKEYNMFDVARPTAATFNNEVAEVKATAGQTRQVVADTARFKGPVAETCVEATDALVKSLSNSMENYNIIKKYLDDVSDSYKAGDTAARNNLLGVSDVPSGFKTSPRSSVTIPDVKQSITMTGYGKEGWVYPDLSTRKVASGTMQEKVHDKWVQDGCNYKSDIAVMNINGQDCYLVATSPKVGEVGDNLNVKLANGQSYPAVVADQKSSSDADFTDLGHDKDAGLNVIEFEARMEKYNETGLNPTTKAWNLEWDSDSRIVEVENYGSIFN